MEVKVINKSTNDLPVYATTGSAGLDLRADLSRSTHDSVKGNNFAVEMSKEEKDKVIGIVLNPMGWILIPTGLFTAIPEGYEVQIRPRSGLALKLGIFVLNTPGTIDADYRNEWGIIIYNLGSNSFHISQGDRIAQAVLNKVEQIEWKEVDSLDDTERGLGGFGSSGVA